MDRNVAVAMETNDEESEEMKSDYARNKCLSKADKDGGECSDDGNDDLENDGRFGILAMPVLQNQWRIFIQIRR